MPRIGMAAKKICQESKWKKWEGCFWCHSGYCTAELMRWAYTGSPEAGQISPVGVVFPEQLRMPWLVNFHVPTSSRGDPACMATPTTSPPPWQLLCILSHRLQQGGARGHCDAAFPYRVLRLQEFVLIPGTVKFDFVCAAMNPWSSPEDSSWISEWGYYYITIQGGLANIIIPIRSACITAISEYWICITQNYWSRS